MKQPLPTRIAKWVLVVLISVSILFPLAWMAIAGFKSKTEVLRSPFQFFPEIWRVENYIEILQDPTFSRAMLVTFGGALIFTVLSLFVNSMAAYAFARLEFRFKRFWWVYCVLPMFVPSMAILLTSFVVVAKLGMLDTLAVLIIPGVASAAQMFFMRQFYLACRSRSRRPPSSTGRAAGRSSSASSCPSRSRSSWSWASARTSPTGTPTSGRS